VIIGDVCVICGSTKSYRKGHRKEDRLASTLHFTSLKDHTDPAIETLEKLARAFEVLHYQLFYGGEEPPKFHNLPRRKSSDDTAWCSAGKDRVFLASCAPAEQDGRMQITTFSGIWPKKWPGQTSGEPGATKG
jgi:hypothetical protein